MTALSAAAERARRTGALPRSLRPRAVPVLSAAVYRLYWLSPWRLQQLWRWLLHKLEGGSMFSATLRRIFRRQFGVDVGEYTHGGWIWPFHLDRGTTVGRYCSISDTARTVTHNHPLGTRSTSGLFFHPGFGLVAELGVETTPLEIGSDVWIGHHAVVLAQVRRIGHGAVIGAGAVVGRDVPPYAIVMGNPARVVGYRFDPVRIDALLASRWWERPLDELLPEIDEFLTPAGDARAAVTAPAAAAPSRSPSGEARS